MSEPKFTPGPWFVDHGVPGKPRIFSRADNLIKSMVCACANTGRCPVRSMTPH